MSRLTRALREAMGPTRIAVTRELLEALREEEAAGASAALAERTRERDEARAAFLRVAQAVGVVYSADGHAEEAGSADAVVGEVRRLVAQSAEHDEAQAAFRAELDEWARVADKARAEVERLRRERDEAREALRLSVSAWEAAGMQGRSAHDAILALQRRAEQAEAALDIERAALTAHAVESERERDEAIARAERAEAQLAALRSEVYGVLAEPHAYVGGRERSVLACAIGAADAAAEAYDRRVRAGALREAAACLREHAEAMASGDRRAGVFTAVGMIGARADEIERGERWA